MEEKKKSKLGLGILIGLLMAAVVGLGTYVVFDKVINKEENKENNTVEPTKNKETTNEEAEKIGKDLYTYAVGTLEGKTKLVTSTDNYISSDSNKCKKGIGCLKVTNWEEIKEKYSADFIKKLDYTNNNDYEIVIIDNVAYTYDGYSGLSLEEVSNIEVVSNKENEIEFNIKSVLKLNDGLQMDENGKMVVTYYNETVTMTAKKENNIWKIDSFKVTDKKYETRPQSTN